MNALERAKVETRELEKQLRGRWGSVLSGIYPDIAKAIEKGHKRHVKCPFHGGADDFRIGKDFDDTGSCYCTCLPDGGVGNGFQLIMEVERCSFTEAKKIIIDALGGRISVNHIPVKYSPKKDPHEVEKEDADLRRKITKYWDEAYPLDHPKAEPVRNWLRVRGLGQLALPIPSLRCHPGMIYMSGGEKIGKFVTMLGLVRNMVTMKACTIHRTFLTADGSAKAPLPPGLDARKEYPHPSTSPTKGAAIPLSVEQHPVLSVGEGIETMASAQLIAPEWPAWSALNKTLLTQLAIPDYVKILIVWADRDRSQAGAAAALELVDRARSEGKRAVAFMPPFAIPDFAPKGIDWNNMVLNPGVEAIANHFRVVALKRRVNQVLRELGCDRAWRAA